MGTDEVCRFAFAAHRSFTPHAAHWYRRTPEQIADPKLSWARPDAAFFAAGACHILADRVVTRCLAQRLEMIHMRPIHGDRGHHVWVSDGAWAFDFNGWSPESELIRVNEGACRREDPHWHYERVIIRTDVGRFCRQEGFRAPWQFPGNVTDRADRFIDWLVASGRF